MSDGRRTKLKEAVHLPNMKLEVPAAESTPDKPAQSGADLSQAQGGGDAAGPRGIFRLSAGKERARSAASGASRPTRLAAAPSKLNRRSLLKWAAGTAVVGEAVTLGYPMVTGQNIPAHGVSTAAPPTPKPSAIISIANWSIRRPTCGGRQFRQLGAADADQARRRHLRGQPQYRPGARLDLVLELRRLQPDLAPPLRLPERRPGQGLRMDQQHPGRQEFPDLRHPHQHRDAGGRLQHLPRPL